MSGFLRGPLQVSVGRPLQAALAAVGAWLVVVPMAGLADQYPYYAPMGALAAVTGSVLASFRESAQTVVAMAIGAVLALAVTPLPDAVALLVVVGVGTLLGNWKWLGSAAAGIPGTSIFVLIIGGEDPLRYATAYVGLFTLGAAVGFAVVALAGPLPLRQADRALAQVRERLATQLEHLAEGLDASHAPTPGEWDERRHDLEPVVSEMHQLVDGATAAQRVNWRAGRWREAAGRQYRVARMLAQLTNFVEDLTDLLVEEEHAHRADVVLGPTLRPLASAAVADAAALLRSHEEHEGYPALHERARASLQSLVEATRGERDSSEDDYWSAASVVTALRRFLDTAQVPAPTPLASSEPLPSVSQAAEVVRGTIEKRHPGTQRP